MTEPNETKTEEGEHSAKGVGSTDWLDADVDRATDILQHEGNVSVSRLQRRLRWGYHHALSVFSEMVERGLVTGSGNRI